MNKVQLLVQPELDCMDKWEAFCLKESLQYEVLQASFPNRIQNEPWLCEAEPAYRRLGLCVSLHGAFVDTNPVSGDANIRAASRTACEASCRNALRFGAKSVVFHASAHPFLSGRYLDTWSFECAEYYQALQEKYGLALYIENSMDAYPDAMEQLSKRLGGVPGVGFCLDVGHAAYSKTAIDEWFERLGDRIGYLHFSDNLGRFDDHLPLGTGAVDWERVDRLSRFLTGNIQITIEMNNFEDTERSVAFLKDNKLLGQSNE